MDGSEYKRRRIVVEDEDDEEVLSNPDEYVDEQNDPDDEEGEDIMVNWRRFERHTAFGPCSYLTYLI